VLAVVFAPPPQRTSTVQTAFLPGYHGSTSSDLWLYIGALRTLKAFHLNIMVAHIHLTQHEAPENNKSLNKIFGDPWVMSPAVLRVPQPSFTIRCRPSGNHEVTAVRRSLEKSHAAANLHASLEPVFVNTAPFELELPGLLEIESILDKHATGVPLSDVETLSLARVSQHVPGASATPASKCRLLTRMNLAAIFGLESWHLNEHWNVKMPCSPLVNCITGIPVTRDSPEARPCGEPRWCRSCSEYYDALMLGPSPHLLQEVVQRLVKDAFFADSVNRPSIAEEDLPPHLCTSPSCNGLVM
jgi:hypothetical protein